MRIGRDKNRLSSQSRAQKPPTPRTNRVKSDFCAQLAKRLAHHTRCFHTLNDPFQRLHHANARGRLHSTDKSRRPGFAQVDGAFWEHQDSSSALNRQHSHWLPARAGFQVKRVLATPCPLFSFLLSALTIFVGNAWCWSCAGGFGCSLHLGHLNYGGKKSLLRLCSANFDNLTSSWFPKD